MMISSIKRTRRVKQEGDRGRSLRFAREEIITLVRAFSFKAKQRKLGWTCSSVELEERK